MVPSMVNLMENDMAMTLELPMLVSKIKKQICDILDGVFESP
jgi:hypothetical protein